MRRNWILRSADEAAVQQLAQALQLSPLIARFLVGRGFRSAVHANDFLCADLSHLSPPEQMADLPKAVQLIRDAARGSRKILLVGDDDADGLTGTTVLLRAIQRLGGEAEVHIPPAEEGYGLKEKVVRGAHQQGVHLLITIDSGTTHFEEVELARSLGMETIVVDHHDLDPARLPAASAFLNPLRTDCPYPEKELASVGVAFTLARGLAGRPEEAWQDLDLVALGTVADMAPLTGENRILVRAGLHALQGSSKPGLKALIARAGLEGQLLGAEEISFSLAPPLNAAGRMGSGLEGFLLLIEENGAAAEEKAAELFRKNRSRADSGREAFRRALEKVAREINFSRERVIVLEDEQWHPGIIGILATRISRRFHRPTIIIAGSGPSCRGSARSVGQFHLVEALHAVRDHLVQFGGHPGAAGLTIERSRIAAFREAINEVARERMDAAALSPSVDLDGELPLAELTEDLLRDLEMLAPFGMGNPQPLFISRDAQFGREEAGPRTGRFNPWGVRMTVADPTGRLFEAIHARETVGEGWNPRRVRGTIHLAYSPIRRRQEGQFRIELQVKDFRPA